MAKAAADNQELPGDFMTLKAVSQLDRLLEHSAFKSLMQKPEFAAKVREMDGLVYDISQHYKNLRPEEAQRLIETRIPDMLARLDEDFKAGEKGFRGMLQPRIQGGWAAHLLGHMCNHHDMTRRESGAIRPHGVRGLLLCDSRLHPLLDNAELDYVAQRILGHSHGWMDEDIAADRGHLEIEGKKYAGGFGSIHQIGSDHGVPKEALDKLVQDLEDWAEENYKIEFRQEAERRRLGGR